jgi:hypothetical protein
LLSLTSSGWCSLVDTIENRLTPRRELAASDEPAGTVTVANWLLRLMVTSKGGIAAISSAPWQSVAH